MTQDQDTIHTHSDRIVQIACGTESPNHILYALTETGSIYALWVTRNDSSMEFDSPEWWAVRGPMDKTGGE